MPGTFPVSLFFSENEKRFSSIFVWVHWSSNLRTTMSKSEKKSTVANMKEFTTVAWSKLRAKIKLFFWRIVICFMLLACVAVPLVVVFSRGATGKGTCFKHCLSRCLFFTSTT